MPESDHERPGEPTPPGADRPPVPPRPRYTPRPRHDPRPRPETGSPREPPADPVEAERHPSELTKTAPG
jgi:hypothetical protein